MAARPATFDHLKSAKKPLERTVRIFLDDEPLAAYEEAQFELERIKHDTSRRDEEEQAAFELKLGSAVEAVDKARQDVENATVKMKFRSIGRKAYDALVLDNPATDEENEEHESQYGGKAPYSAENFSIALIAASCVEPKMTKSEVRELQENWNIAEFVELFTAALEVNTQRRVADLGKASG